MRRGAGPGGGGGLAKSRTVVGARKKGDDGREGARRLELERLDDACGPGDEDDDVVEVVVVIEPPDPDRIRRTGIREWHRGSEHRN